VTVLLMETILWGLSIMMQVICACVCVKERERERARARDSLVFHPGILVGGEHIILSSHDVAAAVVWAVSQLRRRVEQEMCRRRQSDTWVRPVTTAAL
jgi:hypothetical protein